MELDACRNISRKGKPSSGSSLLILDPPLKVVTGSEWGHDLGQAGRSDSGPPLYTGQGSQSPRVYVDRLVVVLGTHSIAKITKWTGYQEP